MAAQLLLTPQIVYTKSVMSLSFGERLKAFREAAGLTLYELADLTGVREPNLSAIENNRRPASENVLHRIAAVPQMKLTYNQLSGLQDALRILNKANKEQRRFIKEELLRAELQESASEE